eukprot:3493751-Lingulodinium_polyedra.AAC.1
MTGSRSPARSMDGDGSARVGHPTLRATLGGRLRATHGRRTFVTYAGFAHAPCRFQITPQQRLDLWRRAMTAALSA